MITVTFHSFANGAKPFASVIAYLDLGHIAQLAKKGGKTASKGVEAHLNDLKPDVYRTGFITVGAMNRTVARFTIHDNSTQM